MVSKEKDLSIDCINEQVEELSAAKYSVGGHSKDANEHIFTIQLSLIPLLFAEPTSSSARSSSACCLESQATAFCPPLMPSSESASNGSFPDS